MTSLSSAADPKRVSPLGIGVPLTRGTIELKESGREVPMTLDITCQACDATFEADLAELLEDATLECPSCEARAPRAAIEGFTGALDDLFTHLATLRRKFSVVFEVESDDLPPSHDRPGPRAAAEEDEEEEADEGSEDGDETWDRAETPEDDEDR